MGEDQSAVVPEPSGFQCTRCGDCCRGFSDSFGVLLFPEDICRLSEGFGFSKATVLTRYTRHLRVETPLGAVRIPALVHEKGNCIFLRHDNLCAIQHFKPTQCTRTPFSFFWDGGRPYACMENVSIPDDWSSTDLDRDLVTSLLQTQDQQKGLDNGRTHSEATGQD